MQAVSPSSLQRASLPGSYVGLDAHGDRLHLKSHEAEPRSRIEIDFAFAGIEHSFLICDECIGVCGRIVVKNRR
jgi:hypothetical protein